MTEQGRSPSPEDESTPEVPQLRDGLSAVVMPDLVERDRDGVEIRPLSEDKAMARLNNFLGGLNRQGADLVHVMPVRFDLGETPGYAGGNPESTKQVAIVRKATGSEPRNQTSGLVRRTSYKP